MLKRKLSVILAVITMIVMVQACRKLDFFSKESKTPEFTVAEAKEWYYGVFKKSAEWLSYDRQKNGVKLPDWKHGKYIKVGNSEFVEFPLVKAKTKMGITSRSNLSSGEALQVANSSLSRIVFAKTNGKVTVREIDYVPDFNYLKQAGFDISDNYFAQMDKNFTGNLIFKTWGGIELSQNLLNNGKITGKLEKRNTSGNLRTEACEDFLIIIYERNCYTVTNGDVITTECTDWVETERWIETICSNDPECEGLTPSECACMLFGCNSDDGPSGVGDNNGFDNHWNENIKDSTVNNCVDSVLSALSSLENSLPKLIRDFFGKNPQFSLVIKAQVANHTYDGNGNIIPAPGGWTIPNLNAPTFNVYINSLYSDATDLSTVTTIMHEAFHAHLMNEVRLFNNDSAYIRQLYDNYGYLFPTAFANWLQNNPGVPSGTAHHQAIATMYRGLISDAINAFAIHRGLNLPSGYADDLSWAGCSDSQAFQNLSSSVKERIIDRIAAEKDPNNANSINPNNNAAKGNPCN